MNKKTNRTDRGQRSEISKRKPVVLSVTYQVELAETVEDKWQQTAPVVLAHEDAKTICAARNIEAHYRQTGFRYRAVRLTKEVIA